MSCRTEKAWETGPTEEILFIAEEDSEENHGTRLPLWEEDNNNNTRREARRLGWATREVHHHHSFKEATEEEEEGITEETGHRREQTDRK